MEDRSIIHNAFIELLQLSFSGVYPLGNMYFSLAVFVVDKKTVGRLADRPWVADGKLTVCPTLKLTLAVDHRVIDGAPAAEFLGRICEHIESHA